MPVTSARKLQEYSRTAEQTARDALIVNHLWLVRHIMGKVAVRLPASVEFDNLESAGLLGLVEAAGRFDAARGVDFKSFATLRIRGAIFDAVRSNSLLPQVVMQRVSLVAKAQERANGPVSVEDLASATGLSVEQVLDALNAMQVTQVKSLEQLNDDPTGYSPDEPDSGAEYADQKRLLADAITSLEKRERLVVTLYYMEDLRLKEIGTLLKLSEATVSRLLAAAENKMRIYVSNHAESSASHAGRHR